MSVFIGALGAFLLLLSFLLIVPVLGVKDSVCMSAVISCLFQALVVATTFVFPENRASKGWRASGLLMISSAQWEVLGACEFGGQWSCSLSSRGLALHAALTSFPCVAVSFVLCSIYAPSESAAVRAASCLAATCLHAVVAYPTHVECRQGVVVSIIFAYVVRVCPSMPAIVYRHKYGWHAETRLILPYFVVRLPSAPSMNERQ